MQKDEATKIEQFRCTLSKIDWLYHIREFKSVAESKITHLKKQRRFQPSDYELQMRKLLLHMIYLYYVAFITKTDFYIYPHICIDKRNTIFYYYSLSEQGSKFMTHISHQDFKQNIRQHFIDAWNLKMPEQQETQTKFQSFSKNIPQKEKHNFKNPWEDFAEKFVQIFDSEKELTPKDIIFKLQQTKHMQDNILMVEVLSSTIIPCIKFNKTVQKCFRASCQEEPSIIGKIFDPDFTNQGTKDFVNYIIRFFKVLNDFKILGVTTTISDKSNTKPQDDESLLTQFFLSLGRPWVQTQSGSQNSQMWDEKNPTSNQSSEHDYNQGVQSKYFGQIKCQYFWTKRLKPRQLTFRIVVSINKRITPMYFEELQHVWYKLTAKWKGILNNDSQLSSFDPGFILFTHNKDNYQLNLVEQVKCQPFQNALSQIIMTTDKLIIATLVMKEFIIFYEKKSASFQITQQNLNIDDGKLEDIAQSVCLTAKNYHNLSLQIFNQIYE